jgi:hypothetical protein
MEPVLFVERRLKDPADKTENDVIIRIDSPVKSETEWKCSFCVTAPGVGFKKGDEAFGEDGFQALINAIEGSRQVVHTNFPNASWLSEHPGDIGFPVIVPQYIPYPAFELVREKIDQTVHAFMAEHNPGK